MGVAGRQSPALGFSERDLQVTGSIDRGENLIGGVAMLVPDCRFPSAEVTDELALPSEIVLLRSHALNCLHGWSSFGLAFLIPPVNQPRLADGRSGERQILDHHKRQSSARISLPVTYTPP
jgi:hypothetical protein